MFFFVPGPVISLITFPGVIIHEIAHRFFADIAGVPVYQVCYYRIGDPAGYVVHEETHQLKQAFLIAVGPLIINSLLCMLITFTVVYPLSIFNDQASHYTVGLTAWIGFSIGMHAFPSDHDAESFLQVVEKANKGEWLFIISKIFAIIIKIANALRVAWFDLFYAIGLSYVLPLIIGY